MQNLGLEKHQDFSKAQETTINYNIYIYQHIKYISNTFQILELLSLLARGREESFQSNFLSACCVVLMTVPKEMVYKL